MLWPRLPRPNRWQTTLVACGLVLSAVAYAFPQGRAAGAVLIVGWVAGCLSLIRALGPARAPVAGWVLDLSLALVTSLASAALFHQAWRHGGLSAYDWAPHHANLARLVESLREQGSVPNWVHGVSTGDSAYELYPSLPYYLAARAALLTETTDLTLVLVRSGVVIQTLFAVSTSLLARRLLSWPVAALVGLVALFDTGSVWGGGLDGLLKLGVTHSALSNAIWPLALLSVIVHLRRPQLASALCIWASVALSIACHPLGLVSALSTLAGLMLVAATARDVPARRAFAAALHVSLGCALVAAVWMPLSQRLISYAVHFARPGQLSWELFGHVLESPVPEATIGPLVFAGYAGVAVGMLSRRAAPTLLAAYVAVLFAGLLDQFYVLFDLAPSVETARFQTVRLASAAKAAIYVLGAYALHSTFRTTRSLRRDRGFWVASGALAIVGLLLVRGAVPYFDRLFTQFRRMAHWETPDSQGLRSLAQWAAARADEVSPGGYARLLDEDDRRYYSVYHVNALSGLPTVWVGPISCLFLRERIEDISPQSLRRFNVRWVMRRERPPRLGDPNTERRFGRHFVREIPEWDGKFARVEQGEGNALVTRLENETVSVLLQGTSRPALVALGMGYYPRWEAEHEELGNVPVYAVPSVDGGRLHVPAAWLPPGKTTFRPSGALPSDGRGRGLTGAAVLLASGVVLTAWRRRSRTWAYRRLLLAQRYLAAHQRPAALVACALGTLALLGGAVRASQTPDSALQVGNALFAAARVELVRPGGGDRPCPYSVFHGAYRCPGPVLVQDGMVQLLNDAPPSPPFAVPAVVVSSRATAAARVRITLTGQLEGDYWAATRGARVRLQVAGRKRGGAVSRSLGPRQQTLRLPSGAGRREVTLWANVPANGKVEIAVVRQDRLEPHRAYPTPPARSPH